VSERFVANYIENSHFSEASSHLASQNIPRLLWNPKSHYRVQKASQWSLSIGRWIQSTPSHFFMIHFNIILPSTCRSSKLSLPFRFPTKIFCIDFSSVPRIIHSSPFGHRNNMPNYEFGEELCKFLEPPLTSSIFRPNIAYTLEDLVLKHPQWSDTLSIVCFPTAFGPWSIYSQS
jgi:hypothetical protein